MSRDDPNVDRLNDALDAILAGAVPDEACAGLPDAFRPLAEAAARLATLHAAGHPSPTFVLGLEERLRADLRAGVPQPPPAGTPPAPTDAPPGVARTAWAAGPRRALAVCFVLAGALGLGAAVERAAPRDDLYPLKRSLESARTLLSVTAAGRAEAYLELGWRRLREIEEIVAAPNADGARLDGLLDDLATAYRLALAYAHQSGDDRVVFLAQSEARLAYDQLQRWAVRTDARRARALRQVELVVRDPAAPGREILAVTWAPADPQAPPAAVGVSGPGGVAGIAPLQVSVMAPPAVGTQAPTASAPPVEPTAPPPSVAPPTPAAPTVAPSPSLPPPPPLEPTAAATTTVMPPAPEPTARTGRPRPRPPTATLAPPLPSPTEEPWLTATAAPPRHTPDPWAVSPTPPPPPASPTPGAQPAPQAPRAPAEPSPAVASPPPSP